MYNMQSALHVSKRRAESSLKRGVLNSTQNALRERTTLSTTFAALLLPRFERDSVTRCTQDAHVEEHMRMCASCECCGEEGRDYLQAKVCGVVCSLAR